MSIPFQTLEVIGVPLDLGANIRGANMGPSAIRIAGLHDKIKILGFNVFDQGDLYIPVRETLPPTMVQEKYLTILSQTLEMLSERTYQAMHSKRIPLSIGGDHSLAIGSIAGVSKWAHERKEKIGLIWIDAHADINTPKTSPSGNLHGMPVAVILGHGLPHLGNLAGRNGPMVEPRNIALIGLRSIDGTERELCKSSGIHYYTMRDIDQRGLSAIMQEAISIASSGTSGIHVSFDIDGIDPLYAPGVSTPVTGGLSYRESHLALEMLAEQSQIYSMDFVELNPMTDLNHKTAFLTVELIQSLLGKSII